MKYHSARFEDYINECKKNNLHENMKNTFNQLQNEEFKNENHMIFYGKSGIGKYTQALNYIKKYSQSGLKYERKINFALSEKKQYIFKVSDIHFEIDMELLGCNAKTLFNELYYHIIEIFSTKENRNGIILCKNFHKIHSELLDIFYSYMQTIIHKNINLKYIILTEQISFIPDNVLNRCKIISFKKPSKTVYSKCIKNAICINNETIQHLTNIKDLQSDIKDFKNYGKNIRNKIIDKIENYNEINYLEMRDLLYDLFIYDLNFSETLYQIVYHFVKTKKIKLEDMDKIYYKLYTFLKFYNNNYRPIYHLESFIYYLCIVINEL